MKVEFRRMLSESDHNDYRFLGQFDLPAVPDRGELINVCGNPYRVIDRAWSTDKNDKDLWCYIKLIAAKND